MNLILLYYNDPDPTVLQWTWSYCITMDLILLYYIEPDPTVLQWTWSYCITMNLILLYCNEPDPIVSHCTWSIGMWLTRPDTTVRFRPSPRSTSSTYRVSASGCFFTSTILPTLKSNRETSIFSSTVGSFFPFLDLGSTYHVNENQIYQQFKLKQLLQNSFQVFEIEPVHTCTGRYNN